MMNKLELACNAAIDEIRRARMFNDLGFGLDDKRKCSSWVEYGYPQEITFGDLYNLYRRGGIAFGAIDKLVNKCWSTKPYIVQGNELDKTRAVTKWEKEVNALPIWRKFKEADKRRLVGRFSALILRINDGGRFHEPVRSSRTLVDAIPVWESALKIIERNADTGEPEYWQYTSADNKISKIHRDRIFILGDYSKDAVAFLEPAYNNFINLEKVEGGSGESFLKNAARHLSIEYDKEVDFANIAATYGVTVDDLQAKFNETIEAVNRGQDVGVFTQGGKVNTLTSNVSDPRPTYEINLQSISSALDIPARVLAMMQVGERASTEDRAQFNERCEARRESELNYDIEQFIRHLMRVGVIGNTAEFITVWDSLTEPKTIDKLSNAKLMAEIESVSPGIFTSDEIRDAAGYEPFEDPLPDADVDSEDEEA